MSAGKGDRPRPVVKKQYDANFDKIEWGKKENTKPIDIKKVKGRTRYTF